MDPDFLMQILERGGLPAIIICSSFWYINKKDNFFAEQLKQWADKDTEEDERLLEVIKEQNKNNSVNAELVSNAFHANTQELKNLETTINNSLNTLIEIMKDSNRPQSRR